MITQVDDLLTIDTPENVVFGYELAGIGSRFMAALVDTFFILILEAVLTVTALFIMVQVGGEIVAWFIAVLILLALAFLIGYYIFFELLWNGQSPGKWWLGLRVIRNDGKPIGFVESLIRNLVRLIDFLPGAYGGGVLVMFSHSQSCRLGDLAAGTLVVYDQGEITLESLHPAGATPSLASPLLADLPLDKLTAQDLLVVQHFLLRQGELKNGNALGRQLVRQLYQKMELTDPALSDQQLMDLLRAIGTHEPAFVR